MSHYRFLWHFITSLCVLAAAVHSAAGAGVAPRIIRRVAPEARRDARLESAIRREVDQESFSYVYSLVHLSHAAEPEALVYLPGPEFCGSGGCTLLIFAPDKGSYRLISRLTLVHTPVLVSSHPTSGWRDLIVFVSGGGIQSGYYAVLEFENGKYPENPTVEPAKPLHDRVTAASYFAGANQNGSAIVVSTR